MANELGFWNGGVSATSLSTFVNTEYANNNATDHYTAVSGDSITHVRLHRFSSGSARTCTVAIRTVSGGAPDALVHEVAVSVGGTLGEYGADTSFALTNGVTYTITVGAVSASFNVTADALATGTAHGHAPSNTLSATWSPSSTSNFRMELAADVTNTPTGSVVPVLQHLYQH